jgi:cytochrome c553
MRRTSTGLILGAFLMLTDFTAGAADLEAGRAKAKACATCHGMNGISVRPDAPHIAGQIGFYLQDQLEQYRSGDRRHAVMEVVSRDLTDEDIADLAAYYSAIRISAEVPE